MTRGVAYAANDLVTGEDFLKDTVVKMGWVWANDCEWMKRRNSGETRGVAYAADLLIIDIAKNVGGGWEYRHKKQH